MKKFVEMSVTNRKAVNGNILLTANASSATGEALGKFVVKSIDTPTSKGIFVKYIPSKTSFEASKDDANSSLITSIQLVADNQEEVQEWISALKAACLESPTLPPLFKFYLVFGGVSVEDCKIEVAPIQIADALTEFVNKHLVGNDWFGIEVKVDPEFAEKVASTVTFSSPSSTPFEFDPTKRFGPAWYFKE